MLMISLLCTACGTFQLASGIYRPANKTADEQQSDILLCKDQAKNESNTAGRQTGDFLLGLTLVGAPVAYEMDKAKQREVFAQCMTARGYTVLAPTDSTHAVTTAAPATPSTPANTVANVAPATAKVAPAPASVAATAARDDIAELRKLKAMFDSGLITQGEYDKKKQEILNRI